MIMSNFLSLICRAEHKNYEDFSLRYVIELYFIKKINLIPLKVKLIGDASIMVKWYRLSI